MSPMTLIAVGGSLALALLLTAVQLPPGFPEVLGWLRPDWVALVILYWVMAVPQQVGMTTAWIAGVLVDSITVALAGAEPGL